MASLLNIWLFLAIGEAIRDGDIILAQSLTNIDNTKEISPIPLVEALRHGEARLDVLQAMLGSPPTYLTFDAYVSEWPEGERFRDWLGRTPGLQLVAGTSAHGGLPGGYLWACILHITDDWFVLVGDCDDGEIHKPCTDEAEATQALQDLQTIAPFAMHELMHFGYRQ